MFQTSPSESSHQLAGRFTTETNAPSSLAPEEPRLTRADQDTAKPLSPLPAATSASASTEAARSGPTHDSAYRALLSAVLDPTIAIDPRGTIVTASASVETVFGYSPSELAGRNIKLLMTEPHHSQHDAYLAKYALTGETNILGRTREFEVVHKQGHHLVCELSVARADVPGSEPLFIGSFRDVTQRRAAEVALGESERRFRAIFDRSYQFMGLLRTDGTVLEVNQAALDAIGSTRAQTIGLKFWDTPWWSSDPAERARARQAVDAAAQGQFVRFETTHRGADGHLFSVDFSLNPVRDAEGNVALLIPEGRNISELKRAQRAETAMLRALATIGENAAMLAHEIKNPITAVNLALRAVSKQLGEDDRAVLEDLVARMQRLEALMRRTLSFTKPLDLRLARVDVRELVDAAVRSQRPDIVKRGAELKVEVEPGIEIVCDRQLIDEVLTNLIRNALEAVPERPRLVLTAGRAGRGTLFVVEDNGPGIPEFLRNTLFKPFSTTKSSGTGLGLAFCRKVVEEHGGTIEAKASPLGGARFEVRIPNPS
ncbi:MAG: PAS domain S-box protein [Planctomycetes bacterium]|nr:PAS domain S-box protein [Planctomycetota bacterium]